MTNISPDRMIDAYGQLIEEDPNLVEFFSRINEKNTIRIRDLAGPFQDYYNALRGFGFLEAETDHLSRDTKIVFAETGKKFWEKYGSKIEELRN